MASPKPQLSCVVLSPEESSKVQVLDSSEPLVTSSSSVPPCVPVQVIDSSEPLVQTGSSQVQGLDSSEPLVPVIPPSEPRAGCSRTSTDELVMPPSSTSSESDAQEACASGSSGRSINYYVEEIRLVPINVFLAHLLHLHKTSITLKNRKQYIIF